MATGAERQAKYEARRRKELADALAEVGRLQARVAVLERERDRLGGLVGFVLKREAWAAAERRGVKEAEREAEAADDTALIPSEIVVVRAPPPVRAPAAHRRTGSPIPPCLMPAP